MDTYRKILAPVDLDQDTFKTLDVAAKLAGESGGKVYLVHVIQNEEFHLNRAVYRPDEGGGANLDWAKKVSAQELAKLAKERLRAVAHEVHVLVGKPAEKITEIAEQNGVELIVLAKSHKPRLMERLLGSTSYNVVRSAHCDVLVVK